jgi:serine/threonine-protein kinase HipA
MVMINKLVVYINFSSRIKVGILASKDKKIYFEYDKEFLKLGLDISPYKLPLKAGVQRCDDDIFEGIWGVFADSLPDGWGRLLLDRHFRSKGINPNSLTPLDRLAYVGNSGMGALSYEPSTAFQDNFKNIDLDALFKSSQEILKGDAQELVDELLILGGSSGGARPKVLVQISDDKKTIIHNNQTIQDNYDNYMIKFASSNDNNEIGKIEYTYSLMARDAKLDMPDTLLLNGKLNSYFAVKRFDNIKNHKVHMHSFAALVHSDFRYPTLDYDDLLSLTLHLTKNMQEVKKVYRLAVFNLFTHNRDDHVKNFSFLMDQKGTWSFSPVYDITFSYGPGGEHSTTYLGEGKNPTIFHLEKLAQKHSIKEYKTIIGEVKSVVSNWKNYAKNLGISKSITNEIYSTTKLIGEIK